MSFPVVYPIAATAFDTQGFGVLSDAIRCTITEELNGEYELELEYPVGGIHASEIQLRRILAVDNWYEEPGPWHYHDGRQAFRIYRIDKSKKERLYVRAYHVSYDLRGYFVEPFTSEDLSHALNDLEYHTHQQLSCPFTIINGRNNIQRSFKVLVPTATRSVMMGQEGSIIDRYHGEWVFNNFEVFYTDKRGSSRNVIVRAGKNLLDYSKEQDSSEQYSHIIAYAEYTSITQGDKVKYGHLITLNESLRPRQAYILDMSEAYIDSKPTRAELDAYAREYASNNAIKQADLSFSFTWANVSNVEDKITLGDTIKFYDGTTLYTARVTQYEYDVIAEQITSFDVGTPKKKSRVVTNRLFKTGKEVQAELQKKFGPMTDSLLKVKAVPKSKISGMF